MTGASITFVAWPNADTLALNGNPTLVYVGSTTTNSSGNWSGTPDLSALGTSYFESDGSVSVETDITTTDNAYEQSYTTSIASAGNGDPLVANSSNPETINSDFSAQQVTTTMGADTDTESDQVASTSASASANNSNPQDNPPHNGCGPMTYAASYQDEPERFVNLGVDDGITATVNETVQSKHTVGIGAAISGGGRGASGKVSISATKASSAKIDYTHSRPLFNDINYNTYSQTCTGGPHNGTSKCSHPVGIYALQDPGRSYAIQTPLYSLKNSLGSIGGDALLTTLTLGYGTVFDSAVEGVLEETSPEWRQLLRIGLNAHYSLPDIVSLSLDTLSEEQEAQLAHVELCAELAGH